MTSNGTFYVYSITNIINNKIYIGKTNNIFKRFEKHKSANGDCPALHNAIKKYGKENFILNTVGEYETEEYAFEAEIYFIEFYKSNITKYGDQYGYNLTSGGDGVSGHKHSIETRKKLSEALKGRVSANKGKKASDYVRLKQSLSHIGNKGFWSGKQLSEEHKNKLSESHKGIYSGENHPMFGKKMSNDTRIKMSKSHKGLFIGEKSHNSKLTFAIANEIRKLYATNQYTYKELAKKFNLGTTTISRVIKNINYFGEHTNE